MINTYSESSLHRSLKERYCAALGGRMEEEVSGRICDVVCPDGLIYEIQTANLSALVPKLSALLPERSITVVRPLAAVKYIETCDSEGRLVSRRRSPKRETLYSLCRELSGLRDLLLHPHFRLEVIEVCITEIRLKTDHPIQLANRSRRFLKAWKKTDKRLDSLTGREHCFASAQDYLSLLPVSLKDEFASADLAEAGRDAGICLWLLEKMGLISCTARKGRKKWYKRLSVKE